MKKKTIIIIAVTETVLIAAAFLVFFGFFYEKKIDSGDEGSLYSYYYVQKGNALQITVKGKAEGYEWETAEDALYAASVELKKRTDKKTVFLVTPDEENSGLCKVTLLLKKDGFFPDIQYILRCTFEVDRNGKVNLIGNTHEAPEPSGIYGEDAGCPIRVSYDQRRAMYLGIPHGDGETWYAVGDAPAVFVPADEDVGYIVNEDDTIGERQITVFAKTSEDNALSVFSLEGRAAGECGVCFINEKAEKQLTLSVTVDIFGEITIDEVTVSELSKTAEAVDSLQDEDTAHE